MFKNMESLSILFNVLIVIGWAEFLKFFNIFQNVVQWNLSKQTKYWDWETMVGLYKWSNFGLG